MLVKQMENNFCHTIFVTVGATRDRKAPAKGRPRLRCKLVICSAAEKPGKAPYAPAPVAIWIGAAAFRLLKYSFGFSLK